MRTKVWAALALLGVSLASCGIDENIEGCGSEADAVAAEGLMPSAGASFDLAGQAMPLPQGFVFRVRADVLELFVAPGVYCDSGDWGVLQEEYVRLQVHDESAPEDAFQFFPDTHRGYLREQIDYAPVEPLDYSFAHNDLTWQVQAYFAGVYHPRARLMYLRTEVNINGSPIGVSIHYFPNGAGQAISQITAAIDKAIRESSRGDM